MLIALRGYGWKCTLKKFVLEPGLKSLELLEYELPFPKSLVPAKQESHAVKWGRWGAARPLVLAARLAIKRHGPLGQFMLFASERFYSALVCTV